MQHVAETRCLTNGCAWKQKRPDPRVRSRDGGVWALQPQSAQPGLGTRLRDAAAAGAGAEVPTGDQAWIAGLQPRSLLALAHKFVLQNPLVAWKNNSSLGFYPFCFCGH